MNNFKVLQTGMSSNIGGIEKINIELFKELRCKNIIFDYLSVTGPIAFEKEIKDFGGKIFHISPRRKNPFKYYFELASFFIKHKKNYQAIHCNQASLYNIDELVMAFFFGIPIRIVHARNACIMNNKKKSIFFHEFNKYFADIIANRFVACSELAAKFMFTKKRLAKKEYKVIYNAVDLSNFKFNIETREKIRTHLNCNDNFVVGHVGAFLPVKNHKFILKIFKQILKYIPNSKLVLLGDGPHLKEIMDLTRDLSIMSNVKFLGNRKDVYRYMNAFDCFLFPSLSEGFGNALIEAQANGLKCFTTAKLVPKEVNVTGLVYFISDKMDEHLWARDILRNDYSIEKRGKYLEIIESRGFRKDSYTNAMLEIYREGNKNVT